MRAAIDQTRACAVSRYKFPIRGQMLRSERGGVMGDGIHLTARSMRTSGHPYMRARKGLTTHTFRDVLFQGADGLP
ncbi:hypothetical protein [Psittacid alphaherpesvirus 5]|uniref:Uncharacterized protein n=1 Tax=Psittacid alphaherpesvirus 5 TaxID=2972693 RepID=A0A5P9JP22_9ALPH|nr:hypothetical protein QKU09_gp03 [Psittacid alphaherpesvirus 5]QFU14547.1 hypothetical protein [Psittacid alphaherpesvirus 5]UOO01018.1 hypothetical protein [Psittacid alphaherpesvirus 5]